MVKIEIKVDDEGKVGTTFLKDNILVGWCNFSREEQVALLRGLSENFEHGLRNMSQS